MVSVLAYHINFGLFKTQNSVVFVECCVEGNKEYKAPFTMVAAHGRKALASQLQKLKGSLGKYTEYFGMV